jgi:DNA gyrase subunit A
MGVFDLETPAADPPAFLVEVDAGEALLVMTNLGRAFRLPASELPESPVHGRGVDISRMLFWQPEERPAVIIPEQARGYLVLVSEQGHTRRFRHHYFGAALTAGSQIFDVKPYGPPAAACWTSGEEDLFITTRQGRAIRFSEKQVPVQGVQGIRLETDDKIVGIAAVRPEDGVFLLSAEGKGTIRLMSGFSPNKTPGAGGKTALDTDRLVGVARVGDGDEIWIISGLSKIIRFPAGEIPAKESVVQGVNCMALRADETVALTISQPLTDELSPDQ